MRRLVLTRAAFALALVCGSQSALGQGLTAASPRQLLVTGAKRVANAARQTATPVPLRPGVFVLPFATNQPGIGPAPDGAARFQTVDSSFAKLGEPGTLITGMED